MNTIKAQYISAVESLSDEALRETLSGLESHEIGCVNWAEFPYAPQVKFHIAFMLSSYI